MNIFFLEPKHPCLRQVDDVPRDGNTPKSAENQMIVLIPEYSAILKALDHSFVSSYDL